MKYLLDICMVLWTLEKNEEKLKKFIAIIEDPVNELAISVVSYWEIAIKKALGKLDISKDWTDVIEETGLIWLHLVPKHIAELEKLPLLHHDPFDRLLISQSKVEQMALLTHDKVVLQYF
jgi:PIN domain nuclease of toxin-antitoxin system